MKERERSEEGATCREGRQAHQLYVCELLGECRRTVTHQLDVDLGLGVDESLHGNGVHLC